ncbi:MAG: hypothetical protein P4N24_21160 [Acidobacteriota bacterium]|nr:hypothetical protein [Acidobacteriota bacterium]
MMLLLDVVLIYRERNVEVFACGAVTRNRQGLLIEFYDCTECSTDWTGGLKYLEAQGRLAAKQEPEVSAWDAARGTG